ncbi:MAG: hypothetical protein HC883_02690 [Bdellovibrionaceae bacterium]|nr:hypothetical protein [Pseudobdellovibrionaceae bacterium]
MLRRAFFILTLSFSAYTNAGQFDYLPAGQAPEKEFQTLMNSGNYKHALMAWGSAHGLSSFGTSANGKATLAWLLYQNGMALSGLDMVLSTNPKSLNAQLLQTWKTELKNSIWIQKGWMQTAGAWKALYNNDAVNIQIKSRRDIQKALAQADKLPKDNANGKARLWWKIATLGPLINEIDLSLKALKLMRESGQTVVGADQISSAYARILYQKGDLEAALKAFNEVPKSSNLWIESVEERRLDPPAQRRFR